MEVIIGIIYPVLVFTIIFVIFFYSIKRKTKVLTRLSNCLKGSVPKFSFTPSFKGEYQGLNFSVILVEGGRNSPGYLTIFLVKNSFFKLSIHKESILSNLGKKLGIVHEVKINDEAFDKEFLIFSNKPAQVVSYLNNAAIKGVIIELFNDGFNSLMIDGKKIAVKKPNYNLAIDVEPQKVIQILQKLSLLVRGL